MPRRDPVARRAYQKAHHAANRERHLASMSERWYAQYSLTPEQANELKSRPCDSCGRRRKRHVVDHDHTTGQVRGNLCSECNTGLGKLGDSIAGVRLMLDYLVKAKMNHG